MTCPARLPTPFTSRESSDFLFAQAIDKSSRTARLPESCRAFTSFYGTAVDSAINPAVQGLPGQTGLVFSLSHVSMRSEKRATLLAHP